MTFDKNNISTGNKILVAEDNEVNLSMLLDMLSILKHKVIVAKNGQEAIDLSLAEKPELIIMDIGMPVMDGLEATRRLREIEGFSSIPILALTANAREEDKEKCLAAGFNEHLSKPIETKELFEAVNRYLPAI
jgi:two-component system, sensor histidine kinase and response regulator